MSQHIPAEVFPPGDFIREELEAREWTQADFAKILGRPLPAVNELITGKKAITPETARALGDAFGTGAEFWMNLESAYRLSLAETTDQDVGRRAQLYSSVPVGNIIKRGWLQSCDDTNELERSVYDFYGVKSLKEIESRHCMAARKSTSYSKTSAEEWAWWCRARQMAESISVGRYTKNALKAEGLKELHKLIVSDQEARKIPKLLADFGVRLVIVKGLPKMRVDGAAFWVKDKPVIALSLRLDRIDSVWFTLAHEICHVLEEDEPGLDIDLVGKDRMPTDQKPPMERAADLFASNFLIPKNEIDNFVARVKPLYSKVKIMQFASRIGVHPGIVVGQLQHRREIGWGHSREMLVGVKDVLTSTAYTDGWGSIETEEAE